MTPEELKEIEQRYTRGWPTSYKPNMRYTIEGERETFIFEDVPRLIAELRKLLVEK